MLFITILTLLTLHTVRSQKPSPCPDVLIYEPQNSKNDRWYAVVNLSSKESLKGLWLSITLDRPAQLLGNVFGDATTSNNRDFLIRSNDNYILEAGTVTPVRFFVKHSPSEPIPSVTDINLNGRTICSAIEDHTTSRNPSRPTSSSSNRRPANTNNRPSSSTSRPSSTKRPSSNTRPTSSIDSERPNRLSNSNNRPSSVNQEVERPSRPSDSNSRPSTDALGIAIPNRPSNPNNRPLNVKQEEERPNRPFGSNSRPDLDLASPNRPPGFDNRPSSFTDDLEIATPNRPSNSNNRPSSVKQDEERPSRPFGSNARPSSSTEYLELAIPNRPSNNNRPLSVEQDDARPSRPFGSNSGSDFDSAPPNRPSGFNNRPSSFTDDLEIPKPNRPSGFTDDLESFRPNSSNNRFSSGNQEEGIPNRPYSKDQDQYRPEMVSYRPEGSNNGLNGGRPSYGTNREPEGFSTSTRYNQGSSSSSGSQQDNDDFFAGDFSAIVSRPPSNPSTRLTIHRNSRCGVIATQPRPLISYGQDTEPGQWPWHVALYHSKGIQLMYTCGGTLISNSHIVTAAHCVTKPRTNRPINPQNILAYLGKYNLRKFGTEIQDREVGDIYIHPQYNHSGYYNDIAILRLSEPVQVTNYVRPVCLWDEATDLNEVEGKLGTVVGWGFTESGVLTTTLMQAQMPIVSLAQCIYSNRDFFSQFTSEKSYCAGFRNGTSVCNGDSGGGMVFPKKGTNGQNTVWQLRGLVSVGVAFQGKILCDTSQYVVFTDVAKHLDWMQTILMNYP